MTSLDPAVPADFVTLHKAIYGESVDVREAWALAKAATDSADVHVDRQAKTQSRKQEGLAAGLLLGVPAETLAGVGSIKRAANKLREPVAEGPKPAGMLRLRALAHGRTGMVGEAALQTANLGVGMLAARELLRRPKPDQAPVGKSARMALRPVNAGLFTRQPSLTARRPKGSPRPLVAKSFAADVSISKLVPDKKQVFGWAQVAQWQGVEVDDRQGDVVSIEELEKAAYDYVLDARVGGDQHARIAKSDTAPRQTATLIESMVFTPEKIEKMGLPGDFPQAWWIGMQVTDDNTWELIKSGERTGLSVHGTGRRTPVVTVAKGERSDRLRRRTEAAVHPPPVARHETPDSSAVASLGYQRQSRRLAYEMRSRPGQPYNYRADRAQAAAAQSAPSTGRHYATQVRGQLKRKEKVNLADRARLFADPPQPVGKADRKVLQRRRRAETVETGGSLVAGTLGTGFAAAEARKKFAEDHPERYARTTAALDRWGAKSPVRGTVAHDLQHAKPRFTPFVGLLAAGAVAGAAHKYNQASHLRERYRDSELHQHLSPHPEPAPGPVRKDAVLNPGQLRRRQRLQGHYASAGATLGLVALGAKGGAAGARRWIEPAESGARIADNLERHTTTALTAGAGLGALAGFNSARISRSEAAATRAKAGR